MVGIKTHDVQFAAAVMDGHIPSFAVVFSIGEELGHEVLKGEAALLEDTRFSILSKNHVFG